MSSKTSVAFYAQAMISFGAALFAVLAGIYFLPVDGWTRGFMCLGALFLTTSSFTLAKVIRDRQEGEAVYARIDEARVDKLLAEHDPFNISGNAA